MPGRGRGVRGGGRSWRGTGTDFLAQAAGSFPPNLPVDQTFPMNLNQPFHPPFPPNIFQPPPNFPYNPQASIFIPGHGPPGFPGYAPPSIPPSAQNANRSAGRGRPTREKKRATASAADAGDLRGRLSRELLEESAECMICCELIGWAQSTWVCRQQCFGLFHLTCIKTWSHKSINPEDGRWRCPGCQNPNASCTFDYRCFCGATRNPRAPRRGDGALPHSCDAVCGRRVSAADSGCAHKCALTCHPGPCPPCPRNAKAACRCGAQTKQVRCGSGEAFQCDKDCNKMLNCRVHKCQVKCHEGTCEPCQEVLTIQCHCGSSSKEVPCTAAAATSFGCPKECGGSLDCGVHKCELSCHSGDCPPCALSPALLLRCPCGGRKLAELEGGVRSTCSDPVPSCGRPCGRLLSCGSPEAPHRCREPCHRGACPPCPDTSPLVCRCGASTQQLPCTQLAAFAEEGLLCQTKCRKRRRCGQHKCGELCCVLPDHPCPLPCERRLPCKLHRCPSLCHTGRCPPCLEATFEELVCECGTAVIFPPIACGTKPPECDRKCTRRHSCEHAVRHNCHTETECPPCTQLTERRCLGGHEVRKNIPCHLSAISCGRDCGQPLACGHKCPRKCHAGDCPTEAPCRLPCSNPRADCPHACNLPCHDLGGKDDGEGAAKKEGAAEEAECPESACKVRVGLRCPCGRRSEVRRCAEVQKASRARAASRAMNPTAGGATAEDSVLACDSECAKVERNRQVAEALGLGPTADLQAKHTTVYTVFLLEQAKQGPSFILGIERAFTDLVKSVNTSRSKESRSHAFLPMGRVARQTIHEYGEYWGLASASYDAEPQRNVVVSARKGTALVPERLLSEAASSTGTSQRLPPPPAVRPWAVEAGVESGLRSLALGPLGTPRNIPPPPP